MLGRGAGQLTRGGCSCNLTHWKEKSLGRGLSCWSSGYLCAFQTLTFPALSCSLRSSSAIHLLCGLEKALRLLWASGCSEEAQVFLVVGGGRGGRL